jgi:hypothetical protein
VSPVTEKDAEVEAQAVIEAGVEVVIEAVRTGLIIAILIARGGRHRARPASALTLLTTKAILRQNFLIRKAPLDLQIFTTIVAPIRTALHHRQVIGMPILLHPSTEKPPCSAETNHRTDLHQNDKGLEVLLRVDTVDPCLRNVQTSPITEREETEALLSGNEVAGIRVVVLPEEGLLDEVGTAVEKTVVGQISRGREDLDHPFMIGNSILHPTDDLVPLVVRTTVTTIATTDLTIAQTRGIPFNRIQGFLYPLTPPGMILQ